MATPQPTREAKAWQITRPGPMASEPLTLGTRRIGPIGSDELLVRVRTCGVCRTDLHLAEGDLRLRYPDTTPGHEVVGEVAAAGPATAGWTAGDRVGVAWLRETCGACVYCRRGSGRAEPWVGSDSENLCPSAQYTGWDEPGGYAEFVTVPAAFAYRLPDGYSDLELAPLLCAGIIGYRALRRARVPKGGRLGIYGFGGSAHLTAQVAVAQGTRVHVLTRSADARELALDLGAASARDSADNPPEPLDSAIIFAPVGELVPLALSALDRGGTLVIAGIHLTDVPALNYQRHLFQERTLTSVTANTRADGREFLAFAARHRLDVQAVPYPFEHADRALADLAGDRVTGAAVLTLEPDGES
jgi:propanol-preferring alcohol dehydrogenase